MRIFRAAAATALLAMPLTAAAETYQFSNAIFELPHGWDHLRADSNYQILSPDDGPCDYCYFYIARSQPVLGDLAGAAALRRCGGKASAGRARQ